MARLVAMGDLHSIAKLMVSILGVADLVTAYEVRINKVCDGKVAAEYCNH